MSHTDSQRWGSLTSTAVLVGAVYPQYPGGVVLVLLLLVRVCHLGA